jgi:diguanylate cyclase (GGDEF)-like protein/PAS domain S-box-containing protein
MFDDAACGMTQTSLTGELLRVNRSFATMLGYQPEDLLGRSFASLSHPDDRDGDLTRFRSLLSGEVATYRSSKRYLARTGEIVHAELTVSMVLDRAGAPLYCATQTIDVTELRMAQAELMHRSTHDTLTGLANRSLFHTLVDQSLSRASRSGDLVAALFVDLDGFKSINDRFGHSVGDELLVLVAHRLRSAMRHGDVVARFGGDEFVVLCEHCSVTAAVAASQRIIDAVSAPFRIGDISVVIGASVGVAVEPAQLVSADLLLMHADVALYEAKRGGRGKIAIHA